MSVAVDYDIPDEQVDALLGLYRETWFGAGWDRERVESMLAGTDECVVLRAGETGRLLAFAHVVTDYAHVALLRDVAVREGARGEGLGRRLLGAVRTHPRLADLDVPVTVVCPTDLASFYERCGFETRPDGTVLRADLE